ncbi:PREDICTED: testis-expressed sequence 40 protein isoform X3 [Miniopterus natalensis]|uniref:testis-expressed sequence 40 protein isoform X3 n=1 Tax=Miniopterus natalensis TaxID=291302 RepID=UPI0007A70939|nr:PREDICTED: testis-expressed sequence 40 protein isoform X3 [Miniopterus natalensis]
MEEKPFKALAKSSGHHDSVKPSSKSDIRNLWTMATLSQPKVNVQLTHVYEDSEQESSSVSSGTGHWYNQEKAGPDSDSDRVWEEWSDTDKKASIKQGELDDYTSLELKQRAGSSLRSDSEGVEDPKTKMVSSSISSPRILKHTPHRAYWVEQQNRLPLPLIELMESEALEILTKALQSYRSGIGKDHFLTKQLQRYIEGLKRRRNKRQHVSVH